MPKYRCTYTGTTVVGDTEQPCTFIILRDGPCLANATPPPQMHCANPVLTGSEELPEPENKRLKQLAGGILGAFVGGIAVVAIVTNPAGWAIGLGALVGAGLGAFASS